VKYPWRESQFDLVLAFSTLEHIEDPAERLLAFRKLFQLTKPGGYCAVSTPNRWNWRYRRLSRENQRDGKADFDYEYQFSPPELRRELEGAGFEMIRFASDYRPVMPWLGIYGGYVSDKWSEKYGAVKAKFGPRIGYLAQRV
jgi:SAM-dependent methyltransferase